MVIVKTEDGKEIKTNLNGNYSFDSGNGRKTMTMELKKDCRETDEEMFKRLAGYGYKKIMFFLTTTNIRGYYSTVAYCK